MIFRGSVACCILLELDEPSVINIPLRNLFVRPSLVSKQKALDFSFHIRKYTYIYIYKCIVYFSIIQYLANEKYSYNREFYSKILNTTRRMYMKRKNETIFVSLTSLRILHPRSKLDSSPRLLFWIWSYPEWRPLFLIRRIILANVSSNISTRGTINHDHASPYHTKRSAPVKVNPRQGKSTQPTQSTNEKR